jgi:hypothetical protein
LKKAYKKTTENEKNNFKFLTGYVLITVGSLNVFSLLFNKVLESVFKEGGIKHNELVMKLGEALVSNFYRQLKKEFNLESNISDLEGQSSVEESKNLRSPWEINPLELYEKLTSTDDKDKTKLLEMFKNTGMLSASLGNTYMLILEKSCKELVVTYIQEENKNYKYVTFDREMYNEVFVQSIKTIFLPMIARPKI